MQRLTFGKVQEQLSNLFVIFMETPEDSTIHVGVLMFFFFFFFFFFFDRSNAVLLLQFFFDRAVTGWCVRVVFALFVPQLFFIWCLRNAAFPDFSISWIP